jgi:flavin reductase (DIM6/NTAB) family NADH-FMN oxidoreductase RutF
MNQRFRHVEPKNVPVREVFSYLLGGVGPRPIALVSTLSADGIPNLSPFSFFNAFGANPPTVAFAPSRRGRDASLKDTYHNLMATKECVVQCVTFDMVEQVNLASTEYPPDVDEFAKSGLTPVPSDIVKPARVAQSPFQMECQMIQMVHLGDGPSSGNLAICEVLKFHIAERLFENGIINPQKIDLVARMGGDFYCRAHGDAIFVVEKPGEKIGVGYDRIPAYIKESKILSANNLGQLGMIERIPSDDEVDNVIDELEQLDVISHDYLRYKSSSEYKKMLAAALNGKSSEMFGRIEETIKSALEKNDLDFAWIAVLIRGRAESRKLKAVRK